MVGFASHRFLNWALIEMLLAELIPSATLSRLARIAQRMQISGSVGRSPVLLSRLGLSVNCLVQTNHVAILQKERSATLKASLKKAIQDGVNPNKDRYEAHPLALHFDCQRGCVACSDRDEKLSEEKVGRYKKGTHRTIFHVQLFLRLLEVLIVSDSCLKTLLPHELVMRARADGAPGVHQGVDSHGPVATGQSSCVVESLLTLLFTLLLRWCRSLSDVRQGVQRDN